MTMLWVIFFELFALSVTWLIFIVLMMFHRVEGRIQFVRWWRSPYTNQLIGVALIGMIESTALMARILIGPVPLWVFAVIFGTLWVITARWLYLTWRARHRSPSDRE